MRSSKLVAGLFALAAATLTATAASAQGANPRVGVWQMESEAPAPASNVMTYEVFESTGMRVTVRATNARGEESAWGYETLFDGVFRPVWGQEGAQTAVEVVNERTTRILNLRDGRVYQVVINTLSEDGNTINNEYVRLDENGSITGVSHAVYRRIS